VCDATVPLDPFVDDRGRRVTACPECGNAIVLADRVAR
jgi:ribosomal protein S27AE